MTDDEYSAWVQIRDDVWDNLFRARVRNRYYRAQARSLKRRSTITGVVALVTQSGAVVSVIANYPIAAAIIALIATAAGAWSMVGGWPAAAATYTFAASLADNQIHVWQALYRSCQHTPPGTGFEQDHKRALARDSEIMAIVGVDDGGANRDLVSRLEEEVTASISETELAPLAQQPERTRQFIIQATSEQQRALPGGSS